MTRITSALNLLYGAVLTRRYVDEYTYFPAILPQHKRFRLLIRKGPRSRLCLHDRLLLRGWFPALSPTEITLGQDARLEVHGAFTLGDDIKISLSKDARLEIGGRAIESASGITGRSVLMVEKHLALGMDVLVAWDTFLTDCDWHHVAGKSYTQDTLIGDHVWIASSVKVLKGAVIEKNCIVACGAVVTQGRYPEQSLVAGVPARVIQQPCENWSR